MRFAHSDGTAVHLAYCTNVHAAEDLDGVHHQLVRYARPVRQALGVDLLGVGLWLARPAAAVLAADRRAVDELRHGLHAAGLEVVTLNGFPYQGFHSPSVKYSVYQPDWTSRDRLDYTLDLARILAALLPDDARHGSVSTVPLGWHGDWGRDSQARADVQLDLLAHELDALATEIRPVRVGLEPEPGCVLDAVTDALALLGDRGGRIGLSLDTCHLAVGFEDPAPAVAELSAAGIPVVKAQLSAALHAEDPADPATRAALSAFAEQRFLHQTRTVDHGRLDVRDDLPDALDGRRPLPDRSPWRVHFHVPVHRDPTPPLAATTDVTVAALEALLGGEHAVTDHLELETYTWGVLPSGARPQDDHDLIDGITGELAWVRGRLRDLGVKEL
ncbi:TIM barrel protein [Pseudonocardia sp. EV170527-09]|uniref:metabolite traffic protein EboE n=1 Tax=Pseudonocardia sp. EV170527-09 TaxID=2603411 RepID=UPI0011F3A1E9|nr:metabolite traffic protein EboE [Pseudonocardia sp. EV170527-09]KAA1018363.1 TIM barrel protein [Pseudonocardia sp. EV170527-09]